MATILLVDDDESQLALLARILSSANHRVIQARGVAEAVEAVRHEVPDVALLDVRMPRVNGLEFGQMLRGSERLRGVPVVFVTAHVTESVSLVARKVGAEAVLLKPVRARNVLRVVDRLIAESSGAVVA